MGFFAFVFLYAALCVLLTDIFVGIRLSLSYFPFEVLRIAGYRLSPLLWPFYMTTVFLNPGRFRDGFHCAIVWLILGLSLVRTVLPPDVSFFVACTCFTLGNIALWGISYVSCLVLEPFFTDTRTPR